MDGISSLSRLQNTLNDAHTPQSLGVAIREIKNSLMSVAHQYQEVKGSINDYDDLETVEKALGSARTIIELYIPLEESEYAYGLRGSTPIDYKRYYHRVLQQVQIAQTVLNNYSDMQPNEE